MRRGYSALFSPFCIYFLVIYLLMVHIMVDVRKRRSNSPTSVPFKYHAYVFRINTIDDSLYKVVLAESSLSAYSFMQTWVKDNDLNIFYRLVAEDDFCVVGVAGDEFFSQFLFDDLPSD